VHIAQKNVWERMEGEPNRWFQRFERYRLMGNRRSVNAVFEEENNKKQQDFLVLLGIVILNNGIGINELREEYFRFKREKTAYHLARGTYVATIAHPFDLSTRYPHASRCDSAPNLSE
jgi:hypothetical protein